MLFIPYPEVHFDHLSSNIRELLVVKIRLPYPLLDPENNFVSPHVLHRQYLVQEVIKLSSLQDKNYYNNIGVNCRAKSKDQYLCLFTVYWPLPNLVYRLLH